jgi:hypothetical protein
MGRREDELRARQQQEGAEDIARTVVRDAVEQVYRRFDSLKCLDSLELAGARAADRAEEKSCSFYELQAALIERYVRQRRLGRRRGRGAIGGWFGGDPTPTHKEVISWLSDREQVSHPFAEEFLLANGPFEVEAHLCCWPRILKKMTKARCEDLLSA